MIARVREDAPAVGITGIGAYVPVRIVSSEDVGAGLGVNADWIVERSGIRERRVAAGTRRQVTWRSQRRGRRSSMPE